MKKYASFRGMAPVVFIGLLLLGVIVYACLLLLPAPGIQYQSKGAPFEQATHASPHGRVDVNTAGADELTTLPGIGEKTAGNIILQRQENGSFYFPEDLMQVSGIGEKKLVDLLPHISLSSENP